MSIKIGDKVRFLSSVGGGIVVRLIGKERVGVEDSNGFEIPAQINECVIIKEGATALEKAFVASAAQMGNDLALPATYSKSNSSNTAPSLQDNGKKGAFDLKSSLSHIEIKGGNRLTIAIAFLPVSISNLQEGNFECYLINDSNYHLILNYSIAEKNEFSNVYAGIIEPNSKYCIDEFDRFDLTKMERLLVQAIAFKYEKEFEAKAPIHWEMKLDSTKFYRLHSFNENDYFDEKAYILSIVDKDSEVSQLAIDSDQLRKALAEKEIQKSAETKQPSTQKINKSGIIEVDLHIHELLDDFQTMTNSEIIQLQLDCFHQVMKDNKAQKGQKIVFIHGKGEGVLRKALIDEIKLKYSTCLFQDASFREYGFGATMVIIR